MDGEALSRYEAVQGSLGERLRGSIDFHADPPCFILTPEERCPFLNGNGLCDLICELGKDSLCRICAEHPRFYNRLPDRMEVGLGLCCEAAAHLILSRTEPFSLVELSPDDGEEIFEDTFTAQVFQMREGLLAILCDRSRPLNERIRHGLACFDIDLTEENHLFQSYAVAGELLKGMERLDPAWDEYLDALSNVSSSPLHELDGEEGIAFEQLLCYFVYRYFATEADGRDRIPEIRFLMAVFSVSVIHALHRTLGGGFPLLCEISRMYSSEVEYSEENMETLMDEIEATLY